MVWTSFGEALPEAVGIAISPISIILLIQVLVSARPRIGGIVFSVGWTIGVFVVAVVAFALSDRANVDSDPEAVAGGSAVEVGLGLLFFALAFREWRRRPRPGVESEPPKLFGRIASMSPSKVLVLGFANAVVNPAKLPLAISGGVTIARTGVTTGQGITAVLLFTLIACMSVLIPVGAFLLLGDRTRQPLNNLKTWLLANNSTIMIILFIVLGAKMLGSGLPLLN